MQQTKDQIRHAKRMSTKPGHIRVLTNAIRRRAKTTGIEFNVTCEYLETIAPEICPVFKIKLGWCERNKWGKAHSPSLDRIDPNKGYVAGNVQWISHKANAMKQNATVSELNQFANWVKSINL